MKKVLWDLYFQIKQTLLNADIALQATRAAEASRVKEVISLLKPARIQSRLIRIGGEGDGGYLVPDDLDGIEYCFSPGVADYAPFELDLERRGVSSFLADYSVEGPPTGLARAHFIKKYIMSKESATAITLGQWIEQYLGQYDEDLLLQMDIEGSEYEVFIELQRRDLRRFRIMVVEFHGLHGLFDRSRVGVIGCVLRKIAHDFHVVHLHPNNFAPMLGKGGLEVPDVMEVTFLRKDRPLYESGDLIYPHPLDRKCSNIRPDYALAQCWYT